METNSKIFWRVELLFGNKWILLPGKWNTRNDAEWDVGLWKQKVQLYGDPFRYFCEETSVEKEEKGKEV